MRKRTVQSVLARRHMFKNGGMVPPQAQPAGILASSPSLVDAVSNDALSDMGGGTLSMAQGGAAVNMQPSYVFNQGGIVKFNPGGFADKNAIALNAVARVLNGSANLNDVKIVKNSPFADNKKVINAIKKLGPIPLSPGLNIGDYINEQPGEQVAQLKVPVDKLKIGNLSKEDMKIPPQEGTYLSEGEKAIIENANNAVFRPVPNGMDASVVPVTQGDLPPAKLGPPPDLPPAPEIPVDQDNLPPAADRPYIPGIDDLGAEGGSQGVTRELAEATNKNTETNAVEAVVEASKTMGGEDGEMITDDDSIIVIDSEKGVATPVNQDLIFSAIKSNGVNTDEDITLSLSDDIEKMGTKLIKGEPTNIDSLRKRIEALIPAVEDDPQTEGLLIAMLGASIAGGESSNALTNIANGMQKALPGLINFRAKQKGAKRARQTQIASLVIGEEFKREAENRAVGRTIDTEKRAEDRRLNILNTARNSYVTTIPGTINGAVVPKKNFLRLSNEQIENNPEYKNLGLVKMTSKVTANLDQIFKGTEGVNVLSLDDQNTRNKIMKGYWFEPQKMPTEFLEADLIYRIPSQAGIKYGGIESGMFLEPREAKALARGFKDKIAPLLDLSQRVNSLHEIDPSKLVGFKGVQGRLAAGLKAFGMAEEGGYAKQFVDAIYGLDEKGNQKKVSAEDEFGIKGRYILAQLAPMFLNESGKTISDADRSRVARLLGFSVEEKRDEKGNITSMTITGFNKERFNDPDAVTSSIEQVEDLLQKKMDDMTNRYETTRDRFGTSRSVMENGKKKQKFTMKKDPNEETLAPILDVRSLLADKKIRRGIAAGKRMIY